MNIARLQHQMQCAITRGAVPPELAGNARGLEVYRNAWRARLVEALRSNYPVVHRVLGDEAFDALADDYLEAHPPQNRSIRWFGDRLPAYVAGHPDALPHPALVDLVRFEWSICLAFDAADCITLTFDALSTVEPDAWASMCFRCQPAFALLDLKWAVAPVWHALTDTEGDDEPLPPPQAHNHSVLVWRRDLQPMWRTVEPLEADLLRRLQAGESFEQLCLAAVDRVGEAAAAEAVLGHLQQWIADQVLAA